MPAKSRLPGNGVPQHVCNDEGDFFRKDGLVIRSWIHRSNLAVIGIRFIDPVQVDGFAFTSQHGIGACQFDGFDLAIAKGESNAVVLGRTVERSETE